jgi:hypothetical protein
MGGNDKHKCELLIRALIEGEQSGESRVSISDIITSQKAQLRQRKVLPDRRY